MSYCFPRCSQFQIPDVISCFPVFPWFSHGFPSFLPVFPVFSHFFPLFPCFFPVFSQFSHVFCQFCAIPRFINPGIVIRFDGPWAPRHLCFAAWQRPRQGPLRQRWEYLCFRQTSILYIITHDEYKSGQIIIIH